MGTEQVRSTSPKTYQEESEESNKLLQAPTNLTEEERVVWEEITALIISSTRYKKTTADIELVLFACKNDLI